MAVAQLIHATMIEHALPPLLQLYFLGLTEGLYVQQQVKLLYWKAWHSLPGVFHLGKALTDFFVVQSALFLSAVAGSDWASLLSSGCSTMATPIM